MLSSNLKRSVAALGVVAGLLAAAVPASAQAFAGVVGVTNRDSAGHSVLSIGEPEAAGFVNGCAPGWSAPVRQVGSEGVKAPIPAGLIDLSDVP